MMVRGLPWLVLVGCRFGFDNVAKAASDAADGPVDAQACANVDSRFDALGGGTAADPYRLCTAAQWLDLASKPQGWGSAFRLEADLDLGTIAGDHRPIGTMAMPFTGSMDGAGKIVSNYRNHSGAAYLGPFGYVGAGASIHDLAVRDADMITFEMSGGLIGFLGAATVERVASFGPGCYVRSPGYANHKGGLIGETVMGAVVSDAFSNCRVGGGGNGVAGLIGHNDGALARGYYEHATDPVTGNGKVGGLVGWNFVNAAVTDSFTSGDVAGNDPSTDVALLLGLESGTHNGSYFDARRVASNADVSGGTTANGVAVDTASSPDYFFDPANLPMSRWDFAAVWKARPSAYPVLRFLDGKI